MLPVTRNLTLREVLQSHHLEAFLQANKFSLLVACEEILTFSSPCAASRISPADLATIKIVLRTYSSQFNIMLMANSDGIVTVLINRKNKFVEKNPPALY